MPQHCEKKILPYPADLLFNIVSDVSSYPQFLPWVSKSRIYNTEDQGFDADLIVGHKLLQQSYTSRVTLTPYERVEATAIKGPFLHLHNTWDFTPIEEHSTEVSFFIDFKFRNALLTSLIQPLFNEAVASMVKAFEQRAFILSAPY